MARLEDLTDDCLMDLLDRLPFRLLLKMQRVNKRLNRLVKAKKQVKIKAITIVDSKKHLISQSMYRCSDCTRHCAIRQDQVLVVDPLVKDLRYTKGGLITPSRRIRFLNVLTRYLSVKSVDFRYCVLPSDVLLDVVKRCPELECIKLGESMIGQIEWQRVINRIGHKITHFAKVSTFDDPSFDAHLLATVVVMCPNLKRVDLSVERYFNSELMAAIKMLPKNCWFTLKCKALFTSIFNDIDELEIKELDWLLLGSRVDRLSSLTFYNLNNSIPPRCINFAALKKLEFIASDGYDVESVDCLLACKFPKLKVFGFHANRDGLTEDNYNALFQRMISVKKLVIFWDMQSGISAMSKLPRSALHHLINLETILLLVKQPSRNWKPKDVIKQFEKYMDELVRVKKLIINMGQRRHYDWEAEMEDEIELLKEKQKSVQIELFFED